MAKINECLNIHNLVGTLICLGHACVCGHIPHSLQYPLITSDDQKLNIILCVCVCVCVCVCLLAWWLMWRALSAP